MLQLFKFGQFHVNVYVQNTYGVFSRCCPGTLARTLIDRAPSDRTKLRVMVMSRVKLEGEELAEYQKIHQKDIVPKYVKTVNTSVTQPF